jgi:hypothetical protein
VTCWGGDPLHRGDRIDGEKEVLGGGVAVDALVEVGSGTMEGLGVAIEGLAVGELHEVVVGAAQGELHAGEGPRAGLEETLDGILGKALEVLAVVLVAVLDLELVPPDVQVVVGVVAILEVVDVRGTRGVVGTWGVEREEVLQLVLQCYD